MHICCCLPQGGGRGDYGGVQRQGLEEGLEGGGGRGVTWCARPCCVGRQAHECIAVPGWTAALVTAALVLAPRPAAEAGGQVPVRVVLSVSCLALAYVLVRLLGGGRVFVLTIGGCFRGDA